MVYNLPIRSSLLKYFQVISYLVKKQNHHISAFLISFLQSFPLDNKGDYNSLNNALAIRFSACSLICLDIHRMVESELSRLQMDHFSRTVHALQ